MTVTVARPSATGASVSMLPATLARTTSPSLDSTSKTSVWPPAKCSDKSKATSPPSARGWSGSVARSRGGASKPPLSTPQAVPLASATSPPDVNDPVAAFVE